MENVNLYLPGVEPLSTKDKVKLETQFSVNGLEDIEFFEASKILNVFSTRSGIRNTLLRYISKKYNGADINFICHSAGCNYGLIIVEAMLLDLASKLNQSVDFKINSMAYISPEIIQVSKDEKEFIIDAKEEADYYSEGYSYFKRSDVSLKKLRNIALFIKTQKSALNAARELSLSGLEYPLFVARSKGDEYVSPSGVGLIASGSLNSEIYAVNSCYHNPLLSKEGPVIVNKLVEHIKK